MLSMTQIKKINFQGEKIFVGIDTHKNSFRVSLYHEETALRTFTQEAKPDKLVSYLKKNFPGAEFHCAYEAGFSGYGLQKYLTKQGINCMVVHPADIPTTHKEKEFKNDPRDARKIARSLRSNLLEGIYIPSDDGLDYRSVLRVYHDISKNYTRYKNKIKGKLNFYGIGYPAELEPSQKHWSMNFFRWLKEVQLNNSFGTWALQTYVEECLRARQLKVVALKKVRELAKQEKFKRSVDNLTSIKGVGLITAMTFLTEIEDVKRFKRLDVLASYVGLIPSTDSSGDTERNGGITNRGNKYLKYVIIESAWVAIRYDQELLMKYIELKKRMDKDHAIIRIARNVLAKILYVMLNNKPVN